MFLNVISRISEKVEGQINAVDHGTCGIILPSKTRGTTCTCLLPHIAVDFPTSPGRQKGRPVVQDVLSDALAGAVSKDPGCLL